MFEKGTWIKRKGRREKTEKTGYIHWGYCHVASLSSAAVWAQRRHTHTNNATNTPNVWMWRKHKTRRRSDGERERRKGDRDGVICSDQRGRVKRSTSLKALDWGSTQKEDGVPEWRDERERKRKGGTEKEGPIRHRSSSEGGRDTLTTNTGGDWCHESVIQTRSPWKCSINRNTVTTSMMIISEKHI